MAAPRLKLLAWHSYVIVGVIASFLFLLNLFNLVDFRELSAVDLRIKVRGEWPAHQDIVVVEIDDNSLEAVGQWPWPRGFHGVLLDVISQYQPKRVLFDILFTEDSPYPEEDQKFAYAVEKAGNVILPFFFSSLDPFIAYFPIESLRTATAYVGFINTSPDRDGYIRRVHARIEAHDQKFYHGTVVSLMSQFEDKEDAQSWFKKIPLDKDGNFWINYPGSVNVFNRISFNKIISLAGEADDELREIFHNKVVIVGHTATASTDLKPTVFSPVYPGVFSLASAVHTMLTQKFLRSTPVWIHWILIVLFSLAVGWVKRQYPLTRSSLLALGILAGFVVLNLSAFYILGWIFPLFLPIVSMLISFFFMLFIKYMEAVIKDQVVSRELSTATRIQQSFLPPTEPGFENLDVCFKCSFAKQVGGDLFDWIDFGKGRYGLCVGDVSGKGVPAAIYMARAISDFRRENRPEFSPAQVLEAWNIVLAKDQLAGMFLTALYAIVDTNTHRILFGNAGHEPIAFYNSAQDKTEIIDIDKGPPLGLFDGAPYDSKEMPFLPGDAILFMSDGVKELRSPKEEEFGLERVQEIMQKHAPKLPSREIVEKVFIHLERFRKDAPPHDDRTILCIKYKDVKPE